MLYNAAKKEVSATAHLGQINLRSGEYTHLWVSPEAIQAENSVVVETRVNPETNQVEVYVWTHGNTVAVTVTEDDSPDGTKAVDVRQQLTDVAALKQDCVDIARDLDEAQARIKALEAALKVSKTEAEILLKYPATDMTLRDASFINMHASSIRSVAKNLLELSENPTKVDSPDDEIAAIVRQIRVYRNLNEASRALLEGLNQQLVTLLEARGSNWSDDEGYARLIGVGKKSTYSTDALDALLINDPLRYGWLKDYRKQVSTTPRVMVK